MSYTPGPKNDLTDVAGLRVGHAADPHIKTGVTVVIPDAPAVAGVHVMGGAPGTRETDLLAPDKTVDVVHALVLAGGSAFGLDAAAGVMDVLAAEGVGYPVGPVRVPIIPAAILFDLLNGGDKAWETNPYRALGALACQNTGEGQGSVGAGTGAQAGALKGGIASASLKLPSGFTVSALIACNALGNTAHPDTGQFWAAPFELNAEFGGRGLPPAPNLASTFETKQPAEDGRNTTIGIVATDAPLTKAQATRMAVAAHDGLARAIWPAHTPLDGDLIFAMSTARADQNPSVKDLLDIGHAAALCTSRAIAKGIFYATHAPNDPVPTWAERHGKS